MMARTDDPLLAQARRRGDFYSMSGCPDLLFHALEHRSTLPEIAAFLDADNLRILGFDAEAGLQRRYASRFPSDVAKTDLARLLLRCAHGLFSRDLVAGENRRMAVRLPAIPPADKDVRVRFFMEELPSRMLYLLPATETVYLGRNA
jgi:hypothetical protein